MQLSKMSIEGITVVAILSLLIFFYIQMSLSEYLLFALPWTIIYAYLTTNITAMIYIITSYLIIISMIFNLKFKRFRINLNKLKREPKSASTYGKLYKNYRYFISIMMDNYDTNKLWKHIFTADLFWRLFIINFTGFVVFFYTLNLLAWGVYQMIFFNECCAFFTLLIQVTGIHNETTFASKDLKNWISFHPYSNSLSFKLKVLLSS